MSLRYLVKKIVFSRAGSRGFTLIELLTAMAIGLVVVTGGSQILQQTLLLVPKAEASVLAMRQVHFAGDWIVRDALAAQAITGADNITRNLNDHLTSLVFTQVHWTDSENTTTLYFVDTDHKLQRVVTENGTIIDSMPVADSIASLTVLYKEPAGKDRKILTVSILATVMDASENRTYQTAPRSY